MHPSRRHLLALGSAVVLGLSLTACGGDDDSTTTDEPTSQDGTTGGETTTEAGTDGAIGPDHTGVVPEGVENVTHDSETNALSVGDLEVAGTISAECLGNDLGLVISLNGEDDDYGDVSAVLSFQDGALTSVLVQTTSSPDGDAPFMWATSSAPGEELTVSAEDDGGVWTATGEINGLDMSTGTEMDADPIEVVADCSG
jgi:hypothetical protein